MRSLNLVIMTQINIYEAKTQLSKLLAHVEQGEEVVIARAGKPVARLVPVQQAGTKRQFGQDQGLYEIPSDFDEHLSEAVLESFGL